jgi:hypothetical protein
MKNQAIRKSISFAIASIMILVATAMPAMAKWQDNSGDLDFGRDDSSSNTLMFAGGTVAIGVGVWAIVRHAKKKKRQRMQKRIADRNAAMLTEESVETMPLLATIDKGSAKEKPEVAKQWLKQSLEQMDEARAAAHK